MTEQQKMKVRIVIRAPTGNGGAADDAPGLEAPDEHNLIGEEEPEGWNWLAIGSALALVALVGAGSWYWWSGQETETTLAGDVALESGSGSLGVADAGSGNVATLELVDSTGPAENAGSELSEPQSESATAIVPEPEPEPEPETMEKMASGVVEAATTAADIESDAITPLSPEPETTEELVSAAAATIAHPAGVEVAAGATEPPPEQLAASPGDDSDIASVEAQLEAEEPKPDSADVVTVVNVETAPALAYAAPSSESSEENDGLEEILSANLTRAQLSWGVYKREPTVKAGATVDVPGPGSTKIYFFTEVSGLRGQTILHRWLFEGQTMATVRFHVGGDRWRVHSNKNISPGKIGNWEVLIEDPNGELLGRRQFRVQAGQSAN